jgi:hypothetical protein
VYCASIAAMAGPGPSIDELRREAERLGVSPTDADLEQVQGFLAVVLPAFAELEHLVDRQDGPAGVFRPEEEP